MQRRRPQEDAQEGAGLDPEGPDGQSSAPAAAAQEHSVSTQPAADSEEELDNGFGGAQALPFLQLPVQGGSTEELPGSPGDCFASRCNKLRTAISVPAYCLVLVMWTGVFWWCWHLMTPAITVWMSAWIALCIATFLWRLAAPADYTRWREVPDALLQLTSFGLGLAWIQAYNLLSSAELALPADQAASGATDSNATSPGTGSTGAVPGGSTAAAANAAGTGNDGSNEHLTSASTLLGLVAHASLLLYITGAVGMATIALSLRVRLSLSLAVQAVVVATALPYTTLVCSAAPLANPAAQQRTHLFYQSLSVFGYMLPLPLSRFVRPNPPDECATVLTWLQISLGLLMPLLWHAVSEAQLFQLHQRQRWEAGLEPERGPTAAVYDTVWWLMLGGSGPPIDLVCWLLLSACWDWTAFFCTPPELRM